MAKKKSKKTKALVPDVVDKENKVILQAKAKKKSRGEKPLDARQKRFCEEYIIDLNGYKAAIRAGYSEKSSRQQASDLLSRPNISQYISELKDKRSERTEITADRTVKEVANIGYSNIKKIASWDAEGNLTVIPSDEMSDDVAASIETIKMEKVTLFTKREKAWDENGDRNDIIEETVKTTLTVKLAKKMPALLLLMKHQGLLDTISSDEDQVLTKALEEIKRGR